MKVCGSAMVSGGLLACRAAIRLADPLRQSRDAPVASTTPSGFARCVALAVENTTAGARRLEVDDLTPAADAWVPGVDGCRLPGGGMRTEYRGGPTGRSARFGRPRRRGDD